jgi:energy-coupling factor transporter ATP-binding protein EcfA2
VENVGSGDNGGKVARKIKTVIMSKQKGRVIVLFGGKGSGKSTFVRRLLELKPPEYIDKNATIVVVDLLHIPGTKEEISSHIWKSLISGLDKDNLLQDERATLLKLFEDKYNLAIKQELIGLDKDGEKFNLMLNQRLADWKNEHQYVAVRLADYWNKKNKGIVVVIDNTDQYNTELQDYCFTLAQQISSVISSVTIISMREERFRDSKIHGLLDAYQNEGYHIQSPAPHAVFKSRILYSKDILDSDEIANTGTSQQKKKVADSKVFFDVLVKEFSRPNSAIANFFDACAHGNIRLALELFAGYLTSGYTNTNEMVAAKSFRINLHQVLKPVMVPERFFYDESKSEFPNLFKIRSNTKGSHFTSQRILTWLDQNKGAGAGYVGINALKDVFVDQYGMLEELEENLDVLLRYGLIESDNRLDCYSDRVDSIVITPYGTYALRNLCGNFAYLDLITLDCGVYDETIANELAEYGSDDFRYFSSGKKYDRVKLRLDKVDSFLGYLSLEMARETERYGIDPRFGDVLAPVLNAYNTDKERVLRSAAKNRSAADE